ncbi:MULTISPECIES: hypothetical protein [Sphingosinicellaceae]|uniref:hypothetical protein n=1 Tax=Sphingosinicellaceae TaxID=2820280 RepID=UPI001C1E31EE|nr:MULTISPECIES: hypothetical protein [Polymorphobacter]QYE33438.1 hypothetical protein KZX46_01245 [Polymorphobacter sp. PAMC 29334]UAJ12804.1 hypothetical protein KTC28_19910 [Polymorphobacter megasporae]
MLRDTEDSINGRIRRLKVNLMAGSSQSTSALTLRPDFDAFLFARVDEVARDVPLRVVSVLARLDLDPWAEAAELTQMPKDTAVHRLTALLNILPDGPSTETESQTIAARLISLLPGSAGRPRGWSSPSTEEGVPAGVNFALLVMISMFMMMIISATMHLASRPMPGDAKAVPAGPPVSPVAERPSGTLP